MRVAIVGLGRMGSAMAARLGGAGHQLSLFDVNDGAALACEAFGRVAASPADAVRDAEAVLISVPGEKEVDRVLAGPAGILEAASPGLVVVDTTTLAMGAARRLAAAAGTRGVHYLDAPVSGGVSRAADGTLVIMASGDAGAWQGVAPMLSDLGSHLIYAGPSGAASAVKLINQAIYVTYMGVFAEGLAAGEALGIDTEALLRMLGPSAAGRPNIEERFDTIRGRADLRFSLASAARYLTMAREVFSEARVQLPMIGAAEAAFAAAGRLGLGSEDLLASRKHYIHSCGAPAAGDS